MNKPFIKIFLLSLCFLETSMCTNIQEPKFPKDVTDKLSKNYKKTNQSKSDNKKMSSIDKDKKDQSEKSFPNHKFLNIQLEDFDYHQSYLGGMTCENSTMTEMYMWRTNLSKAIFKNSTLLSVNLMGADCSEISFSGGTNKKLECDDTSFQDGVFLNTTFEDSDFFDTNFTNAIFNKVTFTKSCFYDSNFSNATLTSVTFESNEFENANFDKAVLTNVTFKKICLIKKVEKQGEERKKFKFTTIQLEPFDEDKEKIEDKKTLFDITINNEVALVKNNEVYSNRKNSQIECTFSKEFKNLTSITLLIGGLTKLVLA